MKPVVAIIGRPNVGKSTLFNAIAKKNIAIIHDMPGATRDRNYKDILRGGRELILVDTGGFETETEDAMARLVKENTTAAIEEADIIIFLMDGRDGLQFGDMEIADILTKTMKPVIYVVNKVENSKIQDNVVDFYRLGIEQIHTVSAKNRTGVKDLMETVCSRIPEQKQKSSELDETVVSIIGRPNVGKSSIINRLLGSERLLVSDFAGTTRDPVDSMVKYKERYIRFIDTAGIRKKARISFNLEKFCVFHSFRCIERSSICILVIDARDGVTTQDAKIASQIHERNRGCIIAVNKWDLIEKDEKTHDRLVRQIYSELPFIDFAPLVIMSALTGHRVRKIFDIIDQIRTTYNMRIATPVLNKGITDILSRKPPPRGHSGNTKVYYATQVITAPPVFKIFTNNPESFTLSYRRYLERSMRDKFGFRNTPVCLQFSRKQTEKHEARRRMRKTGGRAGKL